MRSKNKHNKTAGGANTTNHERPSQPKTPKKRPNIREKGKAPPPSDKQLVCSAISGNKQAFQQLYFKYYKLVTAMLYQKISNPSDAEDLVQESFLKAWSSLPKLRNPDRFLPWLIRIVSHLATDWQRKKQRRAGKTAFSGDTIINMLPYTKDPGARLSSDEEIHAIFTALKQLPQKQRVVLTMRFLEELTPAEIAAKLCEPAGTIRNRIFRGLNRLEKILQRRRKHKGTKGNENKAH